MGWSGNATRNLIHFAQVGPNRRAHPQIMMRTHHMHLPSAPPTSMYESDSYAASALPSGNAATTTMVLFAKQRPPRFANGAQDCQRVHVSANVAENPHFHHTNLVSRAPYNKYAAKVSNVLVNADPNSHNLCKNACGPTIHLLLPCLCQMPCFAQPQSSSIRFLIEVALH